jgi:hypothetical protein
MVKNRLARLASWLYLDRRQAVLKGGSKMLRTRLNQLLVSLLILWLLSLQSSILSYAADNAGAFLKVGSGARALGMG